MHKKRILVFSFILIILGIIYIGLPQTTYILNKRVIKLIGMILISGIALMSVYLVQKLTRSNILTPSILGIERYIILVQIVMLAMGVQGTLLPIVIGSILLMFLYGWLSYKLTNNVTTLMLLGFVMGLFFKSMSDVLQSIMDPNLFQSAFSFQLSTLSKLNYLDLGILLGMCVLLYVIYYKNKRTIEIYSSNPEFAQSLGVNTSKVQSILIFLVGCSSGVLTLLIGPVGFLGLLGIQLAYARRSESVIWDGWCYTLLIFLVAQLVFERLFSLEGSVFIFINVVGGIFLLYSIFKERKSI